MTQRNRFFAGDELEVVSVGNAKTLVANEIYDEKGAPVTDCKLVQQKLFIKTEEKLYPRDMLRIAAKK